MSQDLIVQLSDEAYAAIRQHADESGTSPAQIAAETLERSFRAGREGPQPSAATTETARLAARERFKRHFGAVDLGRATGADNASIDADLAREYADNHEVD